MLRKQSLLPSLTVVADNDPERSAREVVEAAEKEWPGVLLYAPVGHNSGPAGGWAHAVSTAEKSPGLRGDWVLVLDDDDPLGHADVVASLLARAQTLGPRVGGIGLRGARWSTPFARLNRIEPKEGQVAQVDYLAGNGAPLYAWAAIDRLGFFEADLFFGFEDLDMGFRLNRAGWGVFVAPLPSKHVVEDTASSRVPWREYYKTRALTWIVRRHLGRYALGVTLVRSVALGGLRFAVKRPQLLRARVLGAFDGLRGTLGVRRYDPAANPPKNMHPLGQQ